ncbi:hypothetical protein yc1106_02978 [Curvularia clavata]|uniref:F-box domain-containing protein n=1 Tax=Curvularia clavata TaxID=95742 RepID=A0A9Q8Z488_CURCL|nr:hypothetical protein yc1106_02978 [Curvularia clavata]
MNNLPQELVDKICSYLTIEELKKVLLLTRQFRYGAERFCGIYDNFDIEKRNAQEFVECFSGHRLSFLRELKFRPVLPPFQEFDGNGKKPCRETADEVRKRDESFTKEIQWLFHILSLVEDRPSEKQIIGRYRLSVYSPTRKFENRRVCPHHIVIGWRVRLLNIDLPLISSVQSFQIYNNYSKDTGFYFHHTYNGFKVPELKLDLRILVDLATRFPNLEYLGTRTGGFEWCEYWEKENHSPAKDYERDWPGLQRDTRHGFTSAVLSSYRKFPRSLQRAHLDFLNPLSRVLQIHHAQPLPDLVAPFRNDLFSSSLRLLCQNLRFLQLRCIIDESIFLQEDGAVSIWPNLEQLDLMFHPARPNGTWYFHAADGRGSDSVGFPVTDAHYPPYKTTELDKEMDELCEKGGYSIGYDDGMRFRTEPHKRLRPLLEGFAKAAIQMKQLKEAVIWFPLILDSETTLHGGELLELRDPEWDRAWSITYTESSCPIFPGASRRLEWRTAPWRPDPELHRLYQQIGRSKLGDELEEIWQPFPRDDEEEWSDLEDLAKGIFDKDPGCISPTSATF